MSKVQTNEFNISARVVHVTIPVPINDRITKQTLVIETYSDNYRKETPIEFINENTKCLRDIKEKDWVNVDFRIGGWKSMKGGKGTWYPTIEVLSATKQD